MLGWRPREDFIFMFANLPPYLPKVAINTLLCLPEKYLKKQFVRVLYGLTWQYSWLMTAAKFGGCPWEFLNLICLGVLHLSIIPARLYLCGLCTPLVCTWVFELFRESHILQGWPPKSCHIICFHSFKHAGSLFWQTLSSQFAIIRSLCGSTAAVWFGLADFSLCFTHRHICVFVNKQVWLFFSACPGPKCSYIVCIKVYMLLYLHTDRKQVYDVEGKHLICVLPQSDLTWLPKYVHFSAALKVALRCLMPSQSITRWLVGSAVSC